MLQDAVGQHCHGQYARRGGQRPRAQHRLPVLSSPHNAVAGQETTSHPGAQRKRRKIRANDGQRNERQPDPDQPGANAFFIEAPYPRFCQQKRRNLKLGPILLDGTHILRHRAHIARAVRAKCQTGRKRLAASRTGLLRSETVTLESVGEERRWHRTSGQGIRNGCVALAYMSVRPGAGSPGRP